MTVKRTKSNFVYLILLVMLQQMINPLQALDFNLPDILGTMVDVGTSFIDPSILPSAKGLFEGSKNLLVGYPFEFVSSSINAICQQALGTHNIKVKFTPDVNKMNFQLRTPCARRTYPLTHPEEMLTSSLFDRNKKVVILATGWTTTVNGSDTTDIIAKAYNCRGDANFLVVDAAYFVDTLYSWSAFNTEEIGLIIARGLVKLLKVVPVENLHLIGHSLGAHIVGAIGRHVQKLSGKLIPRITGLDPAKPCFNEGESLSGLSRGDAHFVDVIHSNSGVLGKREPIGDADFYPDGLAPLPGGCITAFCAHARSWQYYAESTYPGNERNFLAAKCNSMASLRESHCPGELQPMGYAAPENLKGSYFLEVSATEPFGQHASPTRFEDHKTCGLCETNQTNQSN